jgi:hypothetical protein
MHDDNDDDHDDDDDDDDNGGDNVDDRQHNLLLARDVGFLKGSVESNKWAFRFEFAEISRSNFVSNDSILNFVQHSAIYFSFSACCPNRICRS